MNLSRSNQPIADCRIAPTAVEVLVVTRLHDEHSEIGHHPTDATHIIRNQTDEHHLVVIEAASLLPSENRESRPNLEKGDLIYHRIPMTLLHALSLSTKKPIPNA